MKLHRSITTVMVALFWLLSWSVMHLCAQSQDASALTPLFSITTEPPSGSFHVGKPIEVQVTVKNISGKEIYWAYHRSDTGYRAVQVRLTQNGHEVETTVFDRKITGRPRPDERLDLSYSTIALPLAADASFTWTLDLTKLYVIQSPGKYNLDICRYDDYSKTNVCSKSVTLTVVQ
jgi:hypothetical protein